MPGRIHAALPKTHGYIHGGNAALQGLAQVNRDLMQELGRRCPEQKIATIDLAPPARSNPTAFQAVSFQPPNPHDNKEDGGIQA